MGSRFSRRLAHGFKASRELTHGFKFLDILSTQF